MAYLDFRGNEAVVLRRQACARDIRLGDMERAVILRARRDAQAGRAGSVLPDPRLEALRRHAMLARRRMEAGRALVAAGFSPAERRIVDAMLDALPLRPRPERPMRGRVLLGALILLPLLAGFGTYGWASHYLQDGLIALVPAGLALLLCMPLAASLAAPARQRKPAY